MNKTSFEVASRLTAGQLGDVLSDRVGRLVHDLDDRLSVGLLADRQE